MHPHSSCVPHGRRNHPIPTPPGPPPLHSAAAADPILGLHRRAPILRSAAADPPVGRCSLILHSAVAAGEAPTTKPAMQVSDMEWSPGTNRSTTLLGDECNKRG